MGTADLHIHSAVGDGMAGIPELLAYAEEATDLSVIAVTEHDTLSAALDLRERWAQGRYRFEVVVGEEVTTLEGHLLALYIEEPVASFKPLAATLEAVHRLGGLCVVPHPMSWLTRSAGQRTIERILREGGYGVSFDALEISGSPAARVTSKKAQRLNAESYHLPEIGSSDAHFLQAIGSYYTRFEGSTAAELRRAIEAGATVAVEGEYPSLREIGLRQVAHQQWRGITATPRQMGWLPTIGSFLRRVRP